MAEARVPAMAAAMAAVTREERILDGWVAGPSDLDYAARTIAEYDEKHK